MIIANDNFSLQKSMGIFTANSSKVYMVSYVYIYRHIYIYIYSHIYIIYRYMTHIYPPKSQALKPFKPNFFYDFYDCTNSTLRP